MCVSVYLHVGSFCIILQLLAHRSDSETIQGFRDPSHVRKNLSFSILYQLSLSSDHLVWMNIFTSPHRNPSIVAQIFLDILLSKIDIIFVYKMLGNGLMVYSKINPKISLLVKLLVYIALLHFQICHGFLNSRMWTINNKLVVLYNCRKRFKWRLWNWIQQQQQTKVLKNE